MKQIHVRISDENAAYVDSLTAESGLAQGQVLGMILDKAREIGWQVIPGEAPRVTYHMS